MNRKTFVIFALFLTLTKNTNAQSASNIFISNNVPTIQSKLLKYDLKVLEDLDIQNKSTNTEILKILNISEFNVENITKWLNQRVKYIIEDDGLTLAQQIITRKVFVYKRDVNYPNTNTSIIEKDQNEVAKTVTIMSNTGAGIYILGKAKSLQLGIKIGGTRAQPEKILAINSPRNGIIKIGEGMFMPGAQINRRNIAAFSNSINRISTLFHEARHSDGNGKSLAFSHTVCPKGHDYEGAFACDKSLNGPYSVGFQMLKELSKQCSEKTCTEGEKETLRIVLLDFASRALKLSPNNELATYIDDTPESI